MWVLDHCHDSQVFRGFLCHNCNLALGKLNEDIETLQRAINYLKKDNIKKNGITDGGGSEEELSYLIYPSY